MKYTISLGCLFFAHLYSQDNSHLPKTLHLIDLEAIKETAQKSVKLGLEEVKKQITHHGFPFAEQCLGQAIIQNEKNIVEYICSLNNLNIDYEMEFPYHPVLSMLPGKVTFGKIPLIAGAVVYNIDEEDLFIINCLLKRGASDTTFNVLQKNKPVPCEVTRLAAGLQKEKIASAIFLAAADKSQNVWYTMSPTGSNNSLDMSDSYAYYNKQNTNSNN